MAHEADTFHAPCRHCGAALTLAQMLDQLTECWPYKRWACFTCPSCDGIGWMLPAYEVIAVGELDRSSDASFVPRHRFEPDDYSSHWSSAGLRITIDGRRWTARAAETLW